MKEARFCGLFYLAGSARIALFDHLVGATEQRRGHLKTEALGRLQVDHEFVARRGLHRQIARRFAFENAIDIGRRLPVQIDAVDPVAQVGSAHGKSGTAADVVS
jgi:hypothetical protein